MILDEYVKTTVSQGQIKYWKEKGYEFEGKNPEITVKISDLKSKSMIDVNCKCDKCGKSYTQRFCRNTDTCGECRHVYFMTGNKFGNAHKGKSRPQQSGELHPRWNPNKKELLHYCSKVRWLSEKIYRANIETINPQGFTRTLCGVDGGYQLDHIVSLKNCYEMGMSIEEAASIGNLQMLPWKQNRDKWHR